MSDVGKKKYFELRNFEKKNFSYNNTKNNVDFLGGEN